MDTDPLAEAAEVRRQMLAAFRRIGRMGKTIVIGFAVTTFLLIAILGGIVGITLNTNLAVKDRTALEARNAQLEKTNAELEDVNGQAVDWIVKLSQQIEALGGKVPEIVIRPTTTTVPEE